MAHVVEWHTMIHQDNLVELGFDDDYEEWESLAHESPTSAMFFP